MASRLLIQMCFSMGRGSWLSDFKSAAMNVSSRTVVPLACVVGLGLRQFEKPAWMERGPGGFENVLGSINGQKGN
jgi:hypothetical protein